MATPPNEPPTPDAWDQDAWANDDAWKRDGWKNAEWGKPAASAKEARAVAGRKRGLANWSSSMVEAGPYLSLGLQTAFSMVFFVGVGYAVDRWLGTEPWGLIIGALLGMVAVITLLVRLTNQANADKASRSRPKTGADGA